ncbi:wall-associated receptor kinase-like 14 [Primulina tabacum]|uniref:wall-associated receptor kinase-like 14 n=1 Tax=Primulina tabacum TaxID=48773 RepID=UPI003F59B09C
MIPFARYDFRIYLIGLFLCVFILRSFAQNNDSRECNQSCDDKSVQYPFGFSDGCKIKLSCNRNTGNITIDNFFVQNWTADHILISFPASCNRPIQELQGLFSQNYAPTWRNGLLLKNCSSRLKDCVIPSRLISSQIGDQECNFNVTCYSQDIEDETEFLDYEKVLSKGNCTFLHSSILVDMDGNSGGVRGSSSVTLEFQTAELGWWLDGDCKCAANANCTEVVEGGERKGFRCKCNDGYAGDGFADGEGCKKAVPIYTSSRSRESKVGILMGGVIAGGASVVILAFVFFCIKKRSASLKSILTARRLMSEAVGSSSVPLYPYKEIERATNGFSERLRLGTGAYGTVYAGKLHNDEWVAIKKLRSRDHDSVEQVINEIKLLSSVSHPNLVRLLGCCIENGEHILVYEFMPNGTLSEHLQRERGAVLPWTIRLTVAAETARAISYLHSAMNPIYHRDIKSSNILLDLNFNSKVADFGLSRFGMTDDSHVSTAPQGTPGYVDPQYNQNFHLSDKSDVYSFGVVLVEIISAMKVVDFSRPHSDINLAALAIDRIGKGRVDEIIDPYLEPNRDAWTLSSVHKVAEMAFRCLSFHQDMRPSMMEVADELEQIRRSGWAHLDETMYLGSSVTSPCSSPYHASEKSLKNMAFKKSGVKSLRAIVPSRTAGDEKDCSPVSVKDPWPSEQSSPSASSLLSNMVR